MNKVYARFEKQSIRMNHQEGRTQRVWGMVGTSSENVVGYSPCRIMQIPSGA